MTSSHSGARSCTRPQGLRGDARCGRAVRLGQEALIGTFVANAIRNVWAHSVIFCGHFPDGVDVFTEEMIEGETRGDWYIRQMLGSGNISGSKLMHLMTGNLSHQIEHHCFPDLPSNRYGEVAVEVREICPLRPALHDGSAARLQVFQAWAGSSASPCPRRPSDCPSRRSTRPLRRSDGRLPSPWWRMGSDGAAIRPGLRAAAFFDLDRTLIRGKANYPLPSRPSAAVTCRGAISSGTINAGLASTARARRMPAPRPTARAHPRCGRGHAAVRHHPPCR